MIVVHVLVQVCEHIHDLHAPYIWEIISVTITLTV